MDVLCNVSAPILFGYIIDLCIRNGVNLMYVILMHMVVKLWQLKMAVSPVRPLLIVWNPQTPSLSGQRGTYEKPREISFWHVCDG